MLSVYARRLAGSAALVALATLAPAADPPAWCSLFDGETLSGWKVTEFGGEGQIEVADGAIDLDFGASLSGITYVRDFPRTNYEIELQAQRAGGNDFFCGLTFPVQDSHCSFIVGGWAGAVVGLSSIDGLDASQNETTKFMTFQSNRWYKLRVRVTPEKITCWIDDQVVVDQSIVGRRLTIRSEVNLSRPLGICAWETRARLKDLRYRPLP